jgi:methyl-accepting chemotaxis protein
MDAGIKLLHSNSLEPANNVQIIRQIAESCKQLIDDGINSIFELRASSQITTEAVEKLSLKTRTISSLISTIAEMAEQTKLLAFNATIIATQAGEHGNNFAVVADEITYLSERTSNATIKISNIINSMQKETHLTVDSICKSEANLVNSEQLSQRSAMILDDIIKAIYQTSAQIQQIADAASVRAGESSAIREEINNLVKLIGDAVQSSDEQSELFGKLTHFTDHIRQTTAAIRSEAHDQLSHSAIISNAAEELGDLNNEMQDSGLNLYKQGEIVSVTVAKMREAVVKTTDVATTTREIAEELVKQINTLQKDQTSSEN